MIGHHAKGHSDYARDKGAPCQRRGGYPVIILNCEILFLNCDDMEWHGLEFFIVGGNKLYDVYFITLKRD